jgi:hypothetical protein
MARSAKQDGFPARYVKPNPGVPGAIIHCSAMNKPDSQVVLVHKPMDDPDNTPPAHNYWWIIRGRS